MGLVVTCCIGVPFFLERLSFPTTSSLAWSSSLLFFFTHFIRTVNQAVLNHPLAIVHIYVPEKNGFFCPSSSNARRCSHSLLQRARRAFRHLQRGSSNGISAILSERGTAILHWQSFGRGGFSHSVSVSQSTSGRECCEDPLLAWGVGSDEGASSPGPGLSDLAFWRGLGHARGPRSPASHKCVGLTQKTATDPVAPWSAWTNKAINHWPCRRSSGRPPPSWVEQLHAVRLWGHHILPFGVSHFGVRCLSIVVRMPVLAPSTMPIRPLPLLGNALAGSPYSTSNCVARPSVT